MKYICICIFLTAVMFCNLEGQVGPKPEDGIVKISVPLFAKGFIYKNPEEVDDDGAYRLFLMNKRTRLSIPNIGRIGARDETSKEEYNIDKYEIRVTPGVYSIGIENLENYKLSNFRVNSGQTTNFVIPEYQFAWDNVCYGNMMILKTVEYRENPLPKEFREKPVKVDRITLDPPFFAIVYYCGKKKNGTTVTYSSGKIYYKNHFFRTTSLVIDKAGHKLTAKGDDDLPVDYVIDGGEMRKKKEIIFDLRSNSVIPH